jgi:cell division septal protein FtsQ
MWFKRKPKNRRLERGNVLDVKLRTKEVRAARLRLATTAVGLSLGTVIGLYLLWRSCDWALDQFVFRNDTFAIRELDIRTDGSIPVEQLRKWAGVKAGDNLLALDLNRVKSDLQLSPMIQSVAVERVLPRALKISVIERDPIAQVKLLQLQPRGGIGLVSYYLDETGHVIQPTPACGDPLALNADTLPVLSGFSAAELNPGRAMASPKVTAALRLIAKFEGSPMAGLVDLKSVDLSGTEVLEVITGQGSRITFGLNGLEEQLRHWRLVDNHAKKIGKAVRTLDLSVTNNAPVTWLEAGALPSSAPKPQKPGKKKHV